MHDSVEDLILELAARPLKDENMLSEVSKFEANRSKFGRLSFTDESRDRRVADGDAFGGHPGAAKTHVRQLIDHNLAPTHKSSEPDGRFALERTASVLVTSRTSALNARIVW